MCEALQGIFDDGKEEGRTELLREKVEKKLKKGKDVSVIADELEEEVETILNIIRAMNEAE